MQKVFGSQLVPYVSKSLLYRMFQQAHIRHSPGHLHDVGVYHVPLQATLTSMRYGMYSLICSNQRGILSEYIRKCSFCIIKGESERLYAHTPQDPRAINLLGVQDVAFSIISIDLFSDIWVRHHSKSRGKPSHTVSVLISVDLGTGAVALTMSSDSKSHSVVKCLKTLGLRYKMPKVIICDKGSSLVSLVNAGDLMSQLSDKDITIIPVGQGEQAANFVERQVKEAKRILNTMREDSNSSTYQNSHNQEELLSKLYAVESILNCRPILTSTKSSETQVITPKMLLSPYLSSEEYENWLVMALDPLVAVPHNAQLIVHNNNAVNKQLQCSLLSYLQSEGIRYSTVMGNKSKPDMYNLRPMVEDIVLFNTSDKTIRFAMIVEICKDYKNQVIVKVLHNKILTTVKKHVRNLRLLFRRSEWTSGGIPI